MDQVPPEILTVAQDKYPDLVFDAAFTETEDGQGNTLEEWPALCEVTA